MVTENSARLALMQQAEQSVDDRLEQVQGELRSVMKISRHSTAPVMLRSEAWLMLGISSLPGELFLQSRRLSFTSHNTGSAWPWQLRKLERRLCSPGIATAIDEGKKTQVFNWSTAEVRAWCPWYYFGGGIKLEHAGRVLRFSFGTPGNMKVRPHHTGWASVAEEVSAGFSAVASMRSRGRQWQAALAACSHANHSDS